MTHPSFSLKHNQRLEFLGDAVLELTVSQMLYDIAPKMQEGAMTRKRALMVCEDTLADLANQINLGNYLRLSKDFEAGGGKKNRAVLADAMEAVLAAVYLDGGMDAAEAVIHALWQPRLLAAQSDLDSKGALQAYLQSKGMLEPPEYVQISAEGPAHKRSFEMAVLVEGKEEARAVATTKKKAEMEAAHIALQKISRQDRSDEA